MAKLADAADLKSAGAKALWGFDSPSRHQVQSIQKESVVCDFGRVRSLVGCGRVAARTVGIARSLIGVLEKRAPDVILLDQTGRTQGGYDYV